MVGNTSLFAVVAFLVVGLLGILALLTLYVIHLTTYMKQMAESLKAIARREQQAGAKEEAEQYELTRV